MLNYKEEITNELLSHIDKEKEDPLFYLERIKKYDFGWFYHRHNGIRDKFNPDFYEYKQFMKQLYEGYTQRYFDYIASSEETFLEHFLSQFAASFEPKMYDILVRLQSVNIIYEDAQKVLKTETDRSVNSEAIEALALCYANKDKQYMIESFFSRAFEETKTYCAPNQINADIYLALVKGIVLLPKEIQQKLAPKVQDAYAYLSREKSSYSARQISGYVSVYWTLFEPSVDLTLLQNTLDKNKQYADNKFIFQTQYALWVLQKNQEATWAYYEKNKASETDDYIIALLADLDCKKALPLLKTQLEKTEHPVRKEIILEAIERLGKQSVAPAIKDRMVWMFENVSPTERVLGASSNNVFLDRAKKKVNVQDNLSETDEE